jgi:hypothetical protein
VDAYAHGDNLAELKHSDRGNNSIGTSRPMSPVRRTTGICKVNAIANIRAVANRDTEVSELLCPRTRPTLLGAQML